ncbi:MAG: type IV pilus biogenesis protein PilM, partial [Pseudobdellovibrio sp.]
MFFSSKKVVGIDIGSSSIKLAEMSVSSGGAVLENFAVIPSPQAAITNGEITDSILVSETIRSAFRENGFKHKSACIGLSGTAVIIKKISIPKVDPKKLKEQVQYEA